MNHQSKTSNLFPGISTFIFRLFLILLASFLFLKALEAAPLDPTKCTSDGQCSTGNPCVLGSCDQESNECMFIIQPEGTSCSDGNSCTEGDKCTSGGTCAGKAKNCDDDNDCTNDSCSDGHCVHIPKTIGGGSPCNDKVACTDHDECKIGGICKGEPINENCNDSDSCTNDACSPVSGCINQDNGTCRACAQDSQCEGPCFTGTCNLDTHLCNSHSRPDGTACDDGEFCTVADSCMNGVCLGDINPCDDGDECTNDSCNATAQTCAHSDNGSCEGSGSPGEGLGTGGGDEGQDGSAASGCSLRKAK